MLKGHNILTGGINSGKTTELLKIVLALLAEKRRVMGILSLKVRDGYDAVLLDGDIPRHLPFIRKRRFKGSFKWKRFWFSKKVFNEFGRIAKNRSDDLFVIDEVGPLELDEQKGFYPHLRSAYRNHQTTITVVRTACVQKLLDFRDALLIKA